ncbi:tetratricopeptide repeat protein [Brevundimonas lenta]|uniref:Tetratricopeptide (TPR) repeat protein n=1 Tax=Brevundimonas lenta TaxID=424796 RepID=A0A7W6JGP1_9CAUL|nr:tetratricopeptide repeat protein [Brevundimonas lenta]MBB4083818.1 tetratricopeptide (TPR) repeat protein [Brevundimonas lenta]
MRLSSLLLTGCALLALASPAAAQDAPIVVDPPMNAPAAAPADGAAPEAVGATPAAPPEAPVAPPAPPIPAIWAPVPTDEFGQSSYGLYLSARVANIRGDRTAAAELLSSSQTLTPEQPSLADETFRAGLFSGDLDAVARVAPLVEDTPQLAEAGRLVQVVQALERGDGRTSVGLLKTQGQPYATPFGIVAKYLVPTAEAAAGNWDAALKPVELAPADPNGLILRLQRARALETRRRYDEAEAEYRILVAQPAGAELFSVDLGEFLERRGRRDEARTVYQAVLTGAAPDPAAAAGLQRIDRRASPPPIPTIQQTAADVLQFASLQMTGAEFFEYAAICLRLAESLNPSDEIILRLGHSLAAAEQEVLAREALARVSQANPIVYAGAQYNLALSLQRDDRGAEALQHLEQANSVAPGQLMIVFQLAAQLVELERFDEALAVLDRPDVNVSNQAPQFRFLRGAALERLGRLDEAEHELWAALQSEPNDPVMLNHLGYLWVDSGRRVDQGAEMIARAHAADPENGNIQDSLGWAQYRQGQYETAVETLEGAVAKEPGNAEIVDHLGDAYWQVGRRREAEWQWNRVLTLEPDAERRAEVEQKLATGLPAQTLVAGARP